MVYQLAVRVGSSLDASQSPPTPVNVENQPVFLDSPYFTGQVLVRVQHFSSRTDKRSPSTSPYFDGKRRLYAIEVKGRFKHVWQVEDLWFGVVMDKPFSRIPPGADVGLRLAKMIDPAIMAELKGPQPYSLSPLLCAVQVLNVTRVPLGHRIPETRFRRLTVRSHPIPPDPKRGFLSRMGGIFGPRVNPDKAAAQPAEAKQLEPEWDRRDEVFDTPGPLWLPPWKEGHDGYHLQEGNAALVGAELSAGDRKKYFLKERNREQTAIGPNDVVAFDFYNQYVDLSECQLRLPGMSFDLMKYNDGRPIRYFCQTKDACVVFFMVEFVYE